MNETDVREEIVRPFLHDLGYRHGTQNTIITEKTLRYGYNFLGRKKPGKDRAVEGRADYICQVTSFGRWVLEVKSPQTELTIDVAEQAHTYAAHPEIAAIYFVVTNGRTFRLYRTSRPDTPDLEWQHAEMAGKMLTLRNILGPDGIKRISRVTKPDVGQPLAEGMPSEMQVVGGFVTYEDHVSKDPRFVVPEHYRGARATVVGDKVSRTADGFIEGRLTLAGPTELWDLLNRLGGVEGYTFRTADQFISKDKNSPTIFQNYLDARVPAGTLIPPIPGQTTVATKLPVDLDWSASTEAVGFINGERFMGTFAIEYKLKLAFVPDVIEYSGYGVFDILCKAI
ncbi:type I restriction enzyme HsdR N-terminal domain-containing protein [Mesorhizobium sp. L103C120A0]|uniref:type I restriction enzyme HsdR N-terminal domain-containing protein n=2 Tax=unclassified Mesorhizobium TaxID=325217 RepID=UPI0003D00CF8|nr:type I restriction enzyme HsdR N-terminal domain-containing protein [Mesorhizobium sp. L103C120A0]ESZ55607.1 hypothetical protein X728_28935 [Mesorhizobium sp. L103C120A0]